MKKYTRLELDIRLFNCDTIVTVSGARGNEYTEALTTWQNQNSDAELTKAKMNDCRI